jgi:hypothetical protein
MNCPNYPDEKLLDAYGELDGNVGEYRRHLDDCPDCRGDLAELRVISGCFKRTPARPRLHRWGTPMAAAFLFAFLVGDLFPPAEPVKEYVGPSAVSAEESLSWEEDETHWDEAIASLSIEIGSLEEELRRMP